MVIILYTVLSTKDRLKKTKKAKRSDIEYNNFIVTIYWKYKFHIY